MAKIVESAVAAPKREDEEAAWLIEEATIAPRRGRYVLAGRHGINIVGTLARRRGRLPPPASAAPEQALAVNGT